MRREQLEHIIRACGAIANVKDIVVVGSQAILAQHADAPAELLVSMEADVFPLNHPELSSQIDGAIGELSLFQQTFGYYAHGVDESTAVLPAGWKDRLTPIRGEATQGVTGWCIETHDLAISKLVAGRDKDKRFVARLLELGWVEKAVLENRLATLAPAHRAAVRAMLSTL